MTVAELINELEKMPKDKKVVDFLGDEIEEVNETTVYITNDTMHMVVEIT